MKQPDYKEARGQVWMPVLFSLILIVGMVLGFNLRDSLRNKISIAERNDRLGDIIQLIKERYVDTVNTNRMYEDAVAGILEPLDPHTVYIPATDLQDVNEELEGGFSGIGVEFSIIKDTVEVTAVTTGGPAAKAGMESGDQLIKVGDSLVAGTGITSERITKMLRGKQGTPVKVLLRKMTNGRNTLVTVVRNIVPISSIDAFVMVNDSTGYIKVNKFSANTYTEFADALQKLKDEGAKNLILDLRDNPGGYLDAATAMADDFLKGERTVVSTRGRNSATSEFKSTDGGLMEEGKLVVLVNESSASASEVVAGAIQDWDRGVVVGRRTYGKGLVQEQYDISNGAALRLTTARYYTPSGRSIQRSFAGGRDEYADDLENRLKDGELTGKEAQPIDTTKYYTANHRIVYGGGGIQPDVYVPYDTSRLSDPMYDIAFSDEMRIAIREFYVHHRSQMQFTTVRDYLRYFKSEKDVVNQYLTHLSGAKQSLAKRQIAQPMRQKYVELQVKAQLARYLFRDNGYYSVRLDDDNVVTKALQILSGSQYDTCLTATNAVNSNTAMAVKKAATLTNTKTGKR